MELTTSWYHRLITLVSVERLDSLIHVAPEAELAFFSEVVGEVEKEWVYIDSCYEVVLVVAEAVFHDNVKVLFVRDCRISL